MEKSPVFACCHCRERHYSKLAFVLVGEMRFRGGVFPNVSLAAILAAARKRFRQGAGIPHETFWNEVEADESWHSSGRGAGQESGAETAEEMDRDRREGQ